MLWKSEFIWVCVPLIIKLFSYNLGVLFFLVCTGLGVYRIIIVGWSPNSRYSLLGGLRAVAQTISYEALIFMSLIFLVSGFSFIDIWYLFGLKKNYTND